MSNLYIIKTLIKGTFTKNNIKQVLEHGAQMGFLFYGYTPQRYSLNNPPLNINNATQEIFRALHEPIDDNHNPCIYIAFNEIYFFLYFLPKELACFEIAMSIDSDIRLIPFIDPRLEPIDFAYYIRLLLSICKDFTILNLSTNIT